MVRKQPALRRWDKYKEGKSWTVCDRCSGRIKRDNKYSKGAFGYEYLCFGCYEGLR